jgi:hypothetical protein
MKHYLEISDDISESCFENCIKLFFEKLNTKLFENNSLEVDKFNLSQIIINIGIEKFNTEKSQLHCDITKIIIHLLNNSCKDDKCCDIFKMFHNNFENTVIKQIDDNIKSNNINDIIYEICSNCKLNKLIFKDIEDKCIFFIKHYRLQTIKQKAVLENMLKSNTSSTSTSSTSTPSTLTPSTSTPSTDISIKSQIENINQKIKETTTRTNINTSSSTDHLKYHAKNLKDILNFYINHCINVFFIKDLSIDDIENEGDNSINSFKLIEDNIIEKVKQYVSKIQEISDTELINYIKEETLPKYKKIMQVFFNHILQIFGHYVNYIHNQNKFLQIGILFLDKKNTIENAN